MRDICGASRFADATSKWLKNVMKHVTYINDFLIMSIDSQIT